MKKIAFVSALSIMVTLGGGSFSFAAERKLTTYYPAPYGEYSDLRLKPKAEPVCDSNNEGRLYYDQSQHMTKQCIGDGASSYGWQTFGGVGKVLMDSVANTAELTLTGANPKVYREVLSVTKIFPSCKLFILFEGNFNGSTSDESSVQPAVIELRVDGVVVDSVVEKIDTVKDPGSVTLSWYADLSGTSHTISVHSMMGSKTTSKLTVQTGQARLTMIAGETF